MGRAERKPITGVWGRSPRRGTTAETLVRGPSDEAPWDWKHDNCAEVQIRCEFIYFTRDWPRDTMLTRVLAFVMCRFVWECVSLCLSVTTPKRMIPPTTPRDSPGTLVFWRQESLVEDFLTPLLNTTISTNIRLWRLNRESWRKKFN